MNSERDVGNRYKKVKGGKLRTPLWRTAVRKADKRIETEEEEKDPVEQSIKIRKGKINKHTNRQVGESRERQTTSLEENNGKYKER